MKYHPELYAKVFMEKVYPSRGKEQGDLLRRFLGVVKKNGDYSGIEKIFGKIQESVFKKNGGRNIVLEFAREVGGERLERLKSGFSDRDLVSVSVRPELVAGVRVLVDEELELDMSLKRKLKKLFNFNVV